MLDWLRRHEWIQSEGSSVSQVTSFISFLVMPGCVIGALLHWFLFRE